MKIESLFYLGCLCIALSCISAIVVPFEGNLLLFLLGFGLVLASAAMKFTQWWGQP